MAVVTVNLRATVKRQGTRPRRRRRRPLLRRRRRLPGHRVRRSRRAAAGVDVRLPRCCRCRDRHRLGLRGLRVPCQAAKGRPCYRLSRGRGVGAGRGQQRRGGERVERRRCRPRDGGLPAKCVRHRVPRAVRAAYFAARHFRCARCPRPGAGSAPRWHSGTRTRCGEASRRAGGGSARARRIAPPRHPGASSTVAAAAPFVGLRRWHRGHRGASAVPQRRPRWRPIRKPPPPWRPRPRGPGRRGRRAAECREATVAPSFQTPRFPVSSKVGEATAAPPLQTFRFSPRRHKSGRRRPAPRHWISPDPSPGRRSAAGPLLAGGTSASFVFGYVSV